MNRYRVYYTYGNGNPGVTTVSAKNEDAAVDEVEYSHENCEVTGVEFIDGEEK